jgi:hypothetical protein
MNYTWPGQLGAGQYQDVERLKQRRYFTPIQGGVSCLSTALYFFAMNACPLSCGVISGPILAKLSDGLVFDEESGELIDGDNALEIARRAQVKYL